MSDDIRVIVPWPGEGEGAGRKDYPYVDDPHGGPPRVLFEFYDGGTNKKWVYVGTCPGDYYSEAHLTWNGDESYVAGNAVLRGGKLYTCKQATGDEHVDPIDEEQGTLYWTLFADVSINNRGLWYKNRDYAQNDCCAHTYYNALIYYCRESHADASEYQNPYLYWEDCEILETEKNSDVDLTLSYSESYGFKERPQEHKFTFITNDFLVPLDDWESEYGEDNEYRWNRRPLEILGAATGDHCYAIGDGKYNLRLKLIRGENDKFDISPDLVLDDEIVGSGRIDLGEDEDPLTYYWKNASSGAYDLSIEEKGTRSYGHYIKVDDDGETVSSVFDWIEPEGIFFNCFDTSDSDNFKVTRELDFESSAVEKFLKLYGVCKVKVFLMPRRWLYYTRQTIFEDPVEQDLDSKIYYQQSAAGPYCDNGAPYYGWCFPWIAGPVSCTYECPDLCPETGNATPYDFGGDPDSPNSLYCTNMSGTKCICEPTGPISNAWYSISCAGEVETDRIYYDDYEEDPDYWLSICEGLEYSGAWEAEGEFWWRPYYTYHEKHYIGMIWGRPPNRFSLGGAACGEVVTTSYRGCKNYDSTFKDIATYCDKGRSSARSDEEDAGGDEDDIDNILSGFNSLHIVGSPMPAGTPDAPEGFVGKNYMKVIIGLSDAIGMAAPNTSAQIVPADFMEDSGVYSGYIYDEPLFEEVELKIFELSTIWPDYMDMTSVLDGIDYCNQNSDTTGGAYRPYGIGIAPNKEGTLVAIVLVNSTPYYVWANQDEEFELKTTGEETLQRFEMQFEEYGFLCQISSPDGTRKLTKYGREPELEVDDRDCPDEIWDDYSNCFLIPEYRTNLVLDQAQNELDMPVYTMVSRDSYNYIDSPTGTEVFKLFASGAESNYFRSRY